MARAAAAALVGAGARVVARRFSARRQALHEAELTLQAMPIMVVAQEPLWRVGRSVGRTIYRQRGAEPADSDDLIGVMDSRELAAFVVTCVNAVTTHEG
jgi:hypothetical protein